MIIKGRSPTMRHVSRIQRVALDWLFDRINNRSVQTFRSSTTRQMAKIMVQYGRPSCSSWSEFVRSSFGRTVMGKAIWESPIETWLGENSKLGMSLRSSWERIFLICICGWHKIGWKETQSLIRCGNYSTKKLIWEIQYLSLIMYTWGALNVNVK